MSKKFMDGGVGLWHVHNRATHQCAPKGIRDWLFDQSSLTAKLQQRAGGELIVNVLCQSSGRASLSECRSLGINRRAQCVIREVVLMGPGNVPWVFARSIFPVSSLSGPLRHLKYIGSRPLGGYLFSQPKLKRSAIEVAVVSEAESQIPRHIQQGRLLWGRRSNFSLFGKQLLVSEFFLPELVDAGKQHEK